MEPRDFAREIEQNPVLPDDERERFHGYLVAGLPFRSGHILGLRRFPASSIGPAYTSIWHRDPEGRWNFYIDVPPELGCNRYWGAGVESVTEGPIDIEWTGSHAFSVDTADGEIEWQVELRSTMITRMMSDFSSRLPTGLWHQGPVLTAMGAIGGRLLKTGAISLQGRTCNDQQFEANPSRIWFIPESRAIVNGTDLGDVGPLSEQARLGDFWLPQRGLFAIADSYMEQFDPSRHKERVTGARPFDQKVVGGHARRVEKKIAALR